MITVQGNLAIRVINGRNGAFRVGKLLCEVGEFAIKSKMIEEFEEGEYSGQFFIQKIYPTSYVSGGRITLEVRADLADMALVEVRDVALPTEPVDVDPLSEEAVPAKSLAPETMKSSAAEMHPNDDIDVQPTEKPNAKAQTAPDDRLAALFGSLFPLGDELRLDATVDRAKLREQTTALRLLGYIYNPVDRVWKKQA